MAIVFPISPSVNDTFTSGSITYKWDGQKWIGLGVTPADRLIEGSNSLEITAGNDLVWSGDTVGIGLDPASDGFTSKLHVGGALVVSPNTTTHETIRFTTQGVDEGKIIMQDSSNNEDVVINTGGNSWFNGGNVGIGLTNPEKLFEISGSSSPTIRISNSDGSISADQIIGAIEFKANDGSGDGSQVTGSIESISQAAFTGQGSPSHLIFKTNGTSGADALKERFRITSDGDAILGTYVEPSSNNGISSKTLNFIGGGWNTSNGANEVGTKLQSVHAYWTGNYSNSFGQTYPDFKILMKNSDSATYDEKFAFSSNGVMRLISGGGINFNNYGSGTGITSNILDDYEEGTWSPTIGGTAVYDIQWGYYIKVGKSVQCWGALRPQPIGTGNPRVIQGLPFTAINSPTSTQTGGGHIVWCDNSPNAFYNTPALQVIPNSTYCEIALKTGASAILQATADFWQSNHRANFYITYHAL